MMKRIILLTFLLIFSNYLAYGQKPVIESVNKDAATVGETVTLNGSGFSETVNNNTVYFGATKGEVLSSTSYSMEVVVPPGTTFEQISVTNMESGLTGYSNEKFLLSFNGSGFDPSKLSERINLQEEGGLFDLCVCDFNGDGLNDIATTNNKDKSTSITVFINNINQTNEEISFARFDDNNLLIGEETRNITCGDLDGDGRKDLIIGKGGNIADRLYLARNVSSNGAPDFTEPQEIFTNIGDTRSGTRRIKVMDMDSDGKPEIIMTDQRNANIHIFKNNSTPGDINFSADDRYFIKGENVELGLDIADFNNDGKPDIVYGSNLDANIYLTLNQSTTGSLKFSEPVKFSIDGNMVNIVTGDFNLDGHTDIVVANFINNVYILLNEGSSSGTDFSAPKFVETGRLPYGLDVGDINGDQKPDIIIATNDLSEPVSVLENRSSGGQLSLYQHNIATAEAQRNIKVADFSGDGKPDIAFTVDNVNKVGVVKNQHCVLAEVRPLEPDPICGDNPSKLYATKALKVNYVWQNLTTGDTLEADATLDALTPGEYNVTIVSGTDECATTSNSVLVELGGESLPPAPTINGPEAVCLDETLTLEGGLVDGVTYHWEMPNGERTTGQVLEISNVTAANGGKYTLVLEGADGCRSDATTKQVSISSVPDLEIAASEGAMFCEGSTNLLSVTNIDNGSYKWYRDNSVIEGATSNTLEAGQGGTYSVAFVNQYGCKNESDAYSIQKLAKPDALFEVNTDACLNQALQFNNTSTVNTDVNVEYFWDFGDGTTSTKQSPEHTYTNAQTYTASLKVSYGNTSCTSFYETDITVSEVQGISILVNDETYDKAEFSICDGEQAKLSVPDNVESVEWSTGSTDSAIVVAEEGTYGVKVVQDGNVCTSEDELFVKVAPAVDVQILTDDLRISKGDTVQLEVNGAAEYSWTPPEFVDDPASDMPMAFPETSTVFEVTGSNLYDCTDTASVQLVVAGDRNIKVKADKVITPNGDGTNDVWEIDNADVFSSCSLVIMNRHGQTVFESSSYHNNWDATMNGQQLPEGAYYFVIQCNANEVHTGSITVLR